MYSSRTSGQQRKRRKLAGLWWRERDGRRWLQGKDRRGNVYQIFPNDYKEFGDNRPDFELNVIRPDDQAAQRLETLRDLINDETKP